VELWSPYRGKDIFSIEGAQQRFIRLITKMAGLWYEERLVRQGRYSPDFRRMRGDLIETYEILTGLDAGMLFPQAGGDLEQVITVSGYRGDHLGLR